MPQTLLALCAIMAFAYFALGSQRHDLDVERHAIAAEVELAATDVVWTRVTELERLAYDEEAAETRRVRITPSTAPLGPEPGETPLTFDDLDDWDGVVETETVDLGGGPLRFRVEVEVGYVRDLVPSEPSAVPTMTKELVVRVTELPDHALDRPPATATLRRVVTPVSAAGR